MSSVVKNRSLVLSKYVMEGLPTEAFVIQESELDLKAPLKDGEILVKIMYASIDPTMRHWIQGTFLNEALI